MLTQARNALIGSETTAEVEIDKDTLYGLLSNRRRRHAISILLEEGGMSKRELAERVASREYGKPVCELGGRERKRVLTSLHQSHLRKLADAGVVEWGERDWVRPGSGIGEFRGFVDTSGWFGSVF